MRKSTFHDNLNRTLERFPKVDSNWIDGLKFFLNGYAFERQGRSPAYAPLAIAAIDDVIKSNGSPAKPDEGFSRRVWEKFCELGRYGPNPGYKGANPRRNPLYAEEGKDVIAFCAGQSSSDFNICQFGTSGIRSDLRECHRQLQGIAGIGPKIASFFLRELALQNHESVTDIIGYRELLQPIDVWVRRTAALLTGDTDDQRSDLAAAKELLKLARQAECCDLCLNAGSWYFGAQVVGTLRDLRAALWKPDLILEA